MRGSLFVPLRLLIYDGPSIDAPIRALAIAVLSCPAAFHPLTCSPASAVASPPFSLRGRFLAHACWLGDSDGRVSRPAGPRQVRQSSSLAPAAPPGWHYLDRLRCPCPASAHQISGPHARRARRETDRAREARALCSQPACGHSAPGV